MKRFNEKKLTGLVDGFGRISAQEAVDREARNLRKDLKEMIVRAVELNAENPRAYLQLDVKTAKQAVKLLNSLIRQYGGAKKSVPVRTANRLDISYLVNLGNFADEMRRTTDYLSENTKRCLVRRPYKKRPKATNATVERKQAMLLSGEALRKNVLDKAESKLKQFGIGGSQAVREMFGVNSMWMHGAVRNVMDKAVKELSDFALKRMSGKKAADPDVLHRALSEKADEILAPAFGRAQMTSKISARAVAQSAYHETLFAQINEQMESGQIGDDDFFNGHASFYFKAVMDMKTSHICRALNGMVILASDTVSLSRYTPPLHPNCRSHLIPNLRP